MNTKRNGEGTPIFLLASLTAMKRRLRKRGEARKYLAALALALCVVAGLFPSGVITARADAWPEALESTNGYGMYVINKGGVYDCPSSVKGQVQISGGTSSNPVEIRISGTVTSPWSSTPDLECRSEGYPLFVVRSGYVKFVGSNNATITCEDSHVLSVASLLIGYANLQVSNLTLEGNNGGAFAPVDLGSQDYEMDSTFTNVTIQNWAGSDIGASVQINGGRHNFQNCKFSNNRGFNVGGLVTVSGQTTMKNCVFTQCSSMDNSGGGAIDVSNGATLTLEDCTISECGTDSVGGAVHLEQGGNLTLLGSTSISQNTGEGGNLYLRSGATFTVGKGFTGSVGVTVAGIVFGGVKRQITTQQQDNYQDLYKNGNIFPDNGACTILHDASNYLYLTYVYTVGFDANGGTGAPEARKVNPDESLSLSALPEPTRSGYTFQGWGTAPTEGELLNGNYTPTWDVTLYAQWEKIKNTLTVYLKDENGAPVPETQTVELFAPTSRYTLTGGNGTYSSNEVVNGTYEIQLNGESAGEVTFDATDASQTKEAAFQYTTVSVTTNLDGVPSDTPGAATLRKANGAIACALQKSATGIQSGHVRFTSTNSAYGLYVNGSDVGISVTEGATTQTVNYYTLSVLVTDSSAWTSAAVKLMPGGAPLFYKSTNGNTATYSAVIRANDGTAYDVYVNSANTGESVQCSSNASARTASVKFYTASLNVDCTAALPDTFSASISDGTRSYRMKKGATSGNITPYTAQHVLEKETTYTASVSGVGMSGTALTFTSSAPSQTLTLRVAQFKCTAVTGDGVYDYHRVILRDGGTVSAPFDPELLGYTFDGWSTAPWDKDETSFVRFDFSTVIRADTTLYAHYYPPKVKINGYLRTSADGTANESGTSYRMANLSISGFDKVAIKYVQFSGTNIADITALTSSASWPEGAAYNAGLLTLPAGVSMAQVQQAVRDCIVVTPTSNAESTITVTVMADN